MDKELVFKEAITTHLKSYLEGIGYRQNQPFKGLIKYKSPNNILHFVYEWNQSQDWYCTLSFEKELYDYPINLLVEKNEKNNNASPIFSGDFTEMVNAWAATLLIQLKQIKIESITIESNLIKQLKEEFLKRTSEYNTQLQLERVKRQADKVWHEKNYKLVVENLEKNLIALPKSYTKKFEIAKKKISG